jgi:hypothetical protein
MQIYLNMHRHISPSFKPGSLSVKIQEQLLRVQLEELSVEAVISLKKGASPKNSWNINNNRRISEIIWKSHLQV